jgi:hypothetical protein
MDDDTSAALKKHIDCRHPSHFLPLLLVAVEAVAHVATTWRIVDSHQSRGISTEHTQNRHVNKKSIMSYQTQKHFEITKMIPRHGQIKARASQTSEFVHVLCRFSLQPQPLLRASESERKGKLRRLPPVWRCELRNVKNGVFYMVLKPTLACPRLKSRSLHQGRQPPTNELRHHAV